MAMTKAEMELATKDLRPYTHSVDQSNLRGEIVAYFTVGRKKTFRTYKAVRKWIVADMTSRNHMTVKQAAYVAQMSTSGINYRKDIGDIPFVKLGGAVWIITESFMAWNANPTNRKPGRKRKT